MGSIIVKNALQKEICKKSFINFLLQMEVRTNVLASALMLGISFDF
jgi:hypothetical protein